MLELFSDIHIPNPHKTTEQAMFDYVTLNDDVLAMPLILSYTHVYCTDILRNNKTTNWITV